MVSVDVGACVVGGPASAFRSDVGGFADFTGEVADGVASLAVLAGAVAVEVASPAVAGEVAVLEASLAIAGAVSLANLARVATVVVASLADYR